MDIARMYILLALPLLPYVACHKLRQIVLVCIPYPLHCDYEVTFQFYS